MEWRLVRLFIGGVNPIGSFGGGSQNFSSSMNGNGLSMSSQVGANQQGTFKPFSPTSVSFFVSRSRIVYEGQHGCQELSHLSHEGVCPSKSASGSSGGLCNGKNASGNWAEWFMCRGT